MDWSAVPPERGEPDFDNLLAVLERRIPRRPTLFEFFLNERLYRRLAGREDLPDDPQARAEVDIEAFRRAGYDYTSIKLPNFNFTQTIQRDKAWTVSMDQGAVIATRADFDAFPWPDPDAADYGMLERLAERVPRGMKLIVHCPGGVLENAVELVGFEGICRMLYDDPKLAMDIFGAIGERLARYYERALAYPVVGACISNDDWGFKTQTMFSPRDMRRFVFPWHKRIVETIHAAGRPAILHSCGHFQRIIDDTIDEMGYDARHSYEDSIMPVEEFYERYHARIAVLGGIDLDFVCRAAPEQVHARSRAMLKRAAGRGGYALGTGNSVPEYVPDANYFALLRAVEESRPGMKSPGENDAG